MEFSRQEYWSEILFPFPEDIPDTGIGTKSPKLQADSMAGPLGTPLGLAQRKGASPRGEAGTSGFLSVSHSDRRVPAELGQESQDAMALEEGKRSSSVLQVAVSVHNSKALELPPGSPAFTV